MPRNPNIYIKCSIEGCDGNTIARGWCRTHYYRWKRNGTTDLNEKTVIERFLEMVDLNGPIHPVHGQCHVWIGGTTGGYGMFSVKSKSIRATRYIWKFHFGEIPSGLCVLHRCDNPPCVNPEHLFIGTDTQNIADRDAKGRQLCGPNHWMTGQDHHLANLTDNEVRQIRAEYVPNSSLHGSTALARKYNTTHPTILRIVKGETRKHLPPVKPPDFDMFAE